MSITITQEKYTVLVPFIQGLPGFVSYSLQNDYTLKFAFQSGFACCISKNNRNTNQSVHFENEKSDLATHQVILNAIIQ